VVPVKTISLIPPFPKIYGNGYGGRFHDICIGRFERPTSRINRQCLCFQDNMSKYCLTIGIFAEMHVRTVFNNDASESFFCGLPPLRTPRPKVEPDSWKILGGYGRVPITHTGRWKTERVRLERWSRVPSPVAHLKLEPKNGGWA
jgi:hypothetical protein